MDRDPNLYRQGVALDESTPLGRKLLTLRGLPLLTHPHVDGWLCYCCHQVQDTVLCATCPKDV